SVIPCFRAPHASHSFPTRRSSDLFHRLTTQRITGNHIVASRREVGELGNSRRKHRRAGVRGTITVEPAKFKSGEVSMLRAVSSARFGDRGNCHTTILNRLTQILYFSLKRYNEGSCLKAYSNGSRVGTAAVRRYVVYG